MERSRSIRVGMAAILCALAVRLWAAGFPEAWLQWLASTDTLAFITYLETGRDVRFSLSYPVFSPDFVESPPAATVATLPAYDDAGAISLYNVSGKEADLEALLAQPLAWELRGEAPTVLILHTHATESYTPNGEGYVQSAAYRTLDEDYNMLSLGAYVAQELEAAGIPVLHDTTLHDYPSYNGSYTRARSTIRQQLAEHPTIRLVLDLHRDAVEVSYGQLHTRAQVDGKTAAQLMLVLGTNHDNWQENLALALKLHAQLETQAPGITRPLQLRSQRFNQDLSPGALLIEIGAAGNTHAEALLAAGQLVQAILALSGGTA